jgi:hypothetical protein
MKGEELEDKLTYFHLKVRLLAAKHGDTINKNVSMKARAPKIFTYV